MGGGSSLMATAIFLPPVASRQTPVTNFFGIRTYKNSPVSPVECAVLKRRTLSGSVDILGDNSDASSGRGYR